VPNPAARDSTWSGASSNQWDTAATGNWTNGLVPGAPDDVATFTNTGAGAVTLASPRTVSLINFNSTSNYTLSGSTLTLDASGGYVAVNVFGGTQTIASPVVLGKQTYLGVDASGTLVVSGQISGSTSLTKSGSGTLVLSGNNTLSGPVTLSSGTLVVSGSNNVGDASSTNTLALGGGTLVTTGAFTSPATRSVQMLASSAIEHGANNVEIDGTISGGGKLTSNGTGTLTLGGTNSFTGGLTINNGTAQALVPQGVGTGRITVNGGTLIVPGSVTYSNAITVSGGATLAMGSEGQGTFSGAITDGGSTWTVIPGTITGTTINMTTTTLGATNATGTMVIGSSGTVRLIGTSGGFNVSSLTVDLGGANGVLQNRDAGIGSVQLGGLLGGPGSILRGAGSSGGSTNYHIGYTNANTTFNGSITDGTNPATLALTKEGTGVLTLTGTLSYTGGTTVAAGGLKVNKLAPGAVAVNAGSLQVLAKATPNDISGTSVIASAPSIATGASMDITNNALIVDYTTLGTQLTDLRANLAAGKLISSTKAADQAIGYADANTVGRTTFGGVTLADATNIVVGVVNTGDANVDGHVNALDFNAVATDFGMTGTGIWQLGDFNYDGTVNTLDFNALAGNFNKTLSNAPAPALGSLVPEPASLSAIVLLGFAGRRRRRA
jgi:fibronectin-binding autotransporter adhesin